MDKRLEERIEGEMRFLDGPTFKVHPPAPGPGRAFVMGLAAHTRRVRAAQLPCPLARLGTGRNPPDHCTPTALARLTRLRARHLPRPPPRACARSTSTCAAALRQRPASTPRTLLASSMGRLPPATSSTPTAAPRRRAPAPQPDHIRALALPVGAPGAPSVAAPPGVACAPRFRGRSSIARRLFTRRVLSSEVRCFLGMGTWCNARGKGKPQPNRGRLRLEYTGAAAGWAETDAALSWLPCRGRIMPRAAAARTAVRDRTSPGRLLSCDTARAA
jgi:hypothetical protein